MATYAIRKHGYTEWVIETIPKLCAQLHYIFYVAGACLITDEYEISDGFLIVEGFKGMVIANTNNDPINYITTVDKPFFDRIYERERQKEKEAFEESLSECNK
jgi:hypothetical protein